MANVLRRSLAESDIEKIWWYIAQDSPVNADKFIDKLEDRLLSLAGSPMIGVKRNELMPSLRSFVVDRYVIFYLPIPKGIEVVRVLHGARDLNALFTDESE